MRPLTRVWLLLLLFWPGLCARAAEADGLADAVGADAAKACLKAMQAMDDAVSLDDDLKNLKEGVNPSVLMEDARKIHARLRAQAGALDQLKAPEGGHAILDQAGVYLADALSGLTLAMEGMRLADKPLVRKGLSQVDQALSGMEGLQDSAAGEPVSEGSREIGASLGLSGSWWTSPASQSWNLSLNGAVPVLRNWDIGLGGNLGGGSSTISNSTTTSSSLGWELFTRIHFPVRSAAPYAGLKAGATYTTSKAAGSAETGSTDLVLGPQGGVLVFLSDHAALDLNLRLDMVRSATDGGSGDWKPQLWLTVGARLMN